ncbi:SH3 domain-containing protein [Clostridium sp. MCC353]|uniref:SH3 domain-containing protein n=1 Tax=Clostridium sp. MCC353 TaxID=2592646 RepID=UPI001C02426D|nr:SH3 domain-containing protein [Clostridium sp. MCC353]
MRKYLILTAASLALLLSACGAEKGGENGQSTEATTREIVIEFETQAEKTSPVESAAVSDESALDENQSLLAESETEAVGTSSLESSAEETTTEMPVYKVTPMEKTMYAIKPVNVRAGYTTGTTVLSSLKAGQEVEVTGMSENGWIQIKFNGGEAYVYKTYLSESKDDVETKASAESHAGNSNNSENGNNSNNNGNNNGGSSALAADPAQTPGKNPSQQPSGPAAAPESAPESAPAPITIPPSPIS